MSGTDFGFAVLFQVHTRGFITEVYLILTFFFDWPLPSSQKSFVHDNKGNGIKAHVEFSSI